MSQPNTEATRVLYRIKNWKSGFENHKTRILKKLDWVPMPLKMDGDGYTELLDHPNGAAHLGAWDALVRIAARCPERGTLRRECGTPHDPDSLSRISRIPPKVFSEMIPRILAIGWLEMELIQVESNTWRIAPENAACISPENASTCAAKSGDRTNGTERNGTEEKGTSNDSGAELVVRQHEFPMTAVAVRESFPSTDDRFITQLVGACVQVAVGLDQTIDDSLIADAVRESRAAANGHQKSVGLFLRRSNGMGTVPQCIHTWLTQGRASPDLKQPIPIPTAAERKRMEVCRGLEMFDRISGRKA